MVIKEDLTTKSRLGHSIFLNSDCKSDNLVCFFDICILTNMAGSVGFEPTTLGFGDRCSTNWSYEPNFGLNRDVFSISLIYS